MEALQMLFYLKSGKNLNKPTLPAVAEDAGRLLCLNLLPDYTSGVFTSNK
jgi:hypothetical protein